jgi:transcriptional regulator with XRE-family HTH domain
VDNRAEIREFLITRRARITPAQAGLLPGSGTRRVPGLRREEVAVLAGVSTDWYVRLEKGHIDGVSDEVLNAVAGALQLDEAERAHLFNLARAARPSRTPQTSRSARRRASASPVRASVARVIESITTPAFVRDGLLEILAINPLARALYAPLYDDPVSAGTQSAAHRPAAQPANLARFCFLDPRARDLYPDWDEVASSTVAVLRSQAGRAPYNRALTDLVGELATRSEFFRTAWAAHDVTLHQTGTKYFHHPVVGDVEVSFDSMELPADPGLTLTVYTTEPGSPSHDALAMLASWEATTTRERGTGALAGNGAHATPGQADDGGPSTAGTTPGSQDPH